ncbi:MAG: hypothetical protein Kow0062_07180 [Acidobacteriota bacterium]
MSPAAPARPIRALVLLSVGLLLSGCGRPVGEGTASGASPGVGPTATVEAVRANQGTVREVVETYGTVVFDPHRTRTVSFVNSGQVIQVLVTPGQSVMQGDPLLALGPLPPSSLEVEQARIDLQYARENLERVRRLRESHLATNELVLQAEKRVASAEASLRALGVDSAHGARTIHAPFSGAVVQVLVTSGALVRPGDHAVLLAPANGLAVRAGFEPEDASRLQPGMRVEIVPVFAIDNISPAIAVLERMHRVVDPRTQLLEALIRPREVPDWMAAGVSVRLRTIVRSAADVVRIPREAVVELQGVQGVFDVSSGKAVWRPVSVGLRGRHWIEVAEGLRAGTLVATTGRTSLADGMAVTIAGKSED